MADPPLKITSFSCAQSELVRTRQVRNGWSAGRPEGFLYEIKKSSQMRGTFGVGPCNRHGIFARMVSEARELGGWECQCRVQITNTAQLTPTQITQLMGSLQLKSRGVGRSKRR